MTWENNFLVTSPFGSTLDSCKFTVAYGWSLRLTLRWIPRAKEPEFSSVLRTLMIELFSFWKWKCCVNMDKKKGFHFQNPDIFFFYKFLSFLDVAIVLVASLVYHYRDFWRTEINIKLFSEMLKLFLDSRFAGWR